MSFTDLLNHEDHEYARRKNENETSEKKAGPKGEFRPRAGRGSPRCQVGGDCGNLDGHCFFDFLLGFDLVADLLSHLQDEGDIAQHRVGVRAKLRASLPIVLIIRLAVRVGLVRKILSHGNAPCYVEVVISWLTWTGDYKARGVPETEWF